MRAGRRCPRAHGGSLGPAQGCLMGPCPPCGNWGSGHLPCSRTCSESVELDNANGAHGCSPAARRSAPGLTQGTSTCWLWWPTGTVRQPVATWTALFFLMIFSMVAATLCVWLSTSATASPGDTSQAGTSPAVRGQANAGRVRITTTRTSGMPAPHLSGYRSCPASGRTGPCRWPRAMTSPVIANGIAYIQDQAGTVSAINVASGRVKWQTEASLASASGHTACQSVGEWSSRATPTGVAAFTLSNGSPLRSRQITTTPGEGVDTQTLAYGHRVYVASVSRVRSADLCRAGSVGYLEAWTRKREGRLALRRRSLEEPLGNPA